MCNIHIPRDHAILINEGYTINMISFRVMVSILKVVLSISLEVNYPEGHNIHIPRDHAILINEGYTLNMISFRVMVFISLKVIPSISLEVILSKS